MKYLILLIFILAAVVQAKTPSTARPMKSSKQTPQWCHLEVWPLPRNLPLNKLEAEFSKSERSTLVRMAWNELVHPRPDSVAAPLLRYLSKTEKSTKRRQYFEGIAYLSMAGTDVDKAMRSWPQRHPVQPQSLQQLCSWMSKSS